ncbi:Laminin G domain protein [Corynebacterium kalinowskii]|uniref:Laminin G domain protein n=1 Tax=Corynebacterium kalinowskii TaxID=2675216 RepID=A0A6B8VG06_9CORY|nr:LamG domain-containing protein [Corynebacterium kalinowskii]QGU03063.1 Laminin G domain protein [Corynebacterium kalinowskii]
MSKNSRLAHIVFALFVVLVVCFGLQPSETMGAFTAQLTSENAAGIKSGHRSVGTLDADRTTCERSMGASAADGAIFAYQVQVPSTGRELEDLSPNGNLGLLHIPAMESVFASPCRRDDTQAISIPAMGAKSYIATSQQLQTPGDYTSEMWVRTTAAEGTLMGFYSSQTPDGGRGEATLKLNIDPATGGLVFSTAQRGGYSTAVSGTPINDGQWHHIVARRSADTLSIFTDGILVAETVEAPGTAEFLGYVRIGCDNETGWPSAEQGAACYEGDLAFAAAYSRALDDREITSHYYASQ